MDVSNFCCRCLKITLNVTTLSILAFLRMMCCKRRSIKTIKNIEESLIPGAPSGPAKSRAGCNQAVINIDF